MVADPSKISLEVSYLVGPDLECRYSALPLSLKLPDIMALVQRVLHEEGLLFGRARTPQSIRRIARSQEKVPTRAFGNAPRDEKACTSIVRRAIHPGSRSSDPWPQRQRHRCSIAARSLGMDRAQM